MAKVNELASAIDPVPLCVQATPVLFEALEPAVMFTDWFEQVETDVPATDVGTAKIATEYVAVAAVQGALVTVIVNVTVFPPSAPPGV